MKLCIAGSRCMDDPAVIERGVKWLENNLIGFSRESITEVIEGTARGADQAAGIWARKNGIQVTEMPARWKALGRAAGHKRNLDMAHAADAVVCFWDGKSKGTAHMIECAKAQWKLMAVFDVNGSLIQS